MDRSPLTLDNIRIASPCPADWKQMAGDDRIRHCSQCNLDVYNFSAMTAREVERLVATHEGRLCGRFYLRPDGTMLTKDCPWTLRALGRRASRLIGAAFTAIMSMSLGVAQSKPVQNSNSQVQVNKDEGTILLQVLDGQNGVVGGAEVTVSDSDHQKPLIGVTSFTGQLLVTGLKPRSYVVTVNASHFETFSQTVNIRPGQNVQLTARLELQPIAGSVVIIEVPPMQMIPVDSHPLDGIHYEVKPLPKKK